MFDRLSRSWTFAKLSYGVIWENKRLMVFPMLSLLASSVVLAAFVLPLYNGGQLMAWGNAMAEQRWQDVDPMAYVAAFAFYFCNYFVIVFANTALIASAMAILRGEQASVSGGLAMAMKRLPQIAGWAFVSAIVGIILESVERANDKAGTFVAAILGTGWTILTYFVVPTIVLEGSGPIAAIKRSGETFKRTWGEAAGGYLSLGFFSALLMLPLFLIPFALAFVMGNERGSGLAFGSILAVCAVWILFASAFSSAANAVFKACLFDYANGGRRNPELANAFRR